MLNKRGLNPITLCRVVYQSVDPDEKADGKPGTPMSISAYRCLASHSKREGEVQRAVSALLGFSLAQGEYKDAVLEGAANGFISHDDALSYLRLHEAGGVAVDFTGLESKASLLRSVVYAEENGIDAAKAFNMTRGEIAALKAHGTMGTYKKQDDKEIKKILSYREKQFNRNQKYSKKDTRVKYIPLTEDPQENRRNVMEFFIGLAGDEAEAEAAYEQYEKQYGPVGTDGALKIDYRVAK